MAKKIIPDCGIYLVLSGECGRGRPLLSIARQAVAGGIDILQMRDKQKSSEELLTLGTALRDLCRAHPVLFIVNDDPLLAQKLDADGVHLGQEDLADFPLAQVRKILGPEKIIGISTHSWEQFQDANNRDVDYIAFGPIYETKTKDYHIGTEFVERVVQTAQKPVIAIGGIGETNMDDLLGRGVRHIAMIRGIMDADHIEATARQYKDRLMNRRR